MRAGGRPISLCNFCYKIIARARLFRLSSCDFCYRIVVRALLFNYHLFLSTIILPCQSGFVKGRTIHENVALAIELTFDLDRRARGRNVITNVDMEKAYDRISWSFLLNGWKDLASVTFGASWFSKLSAAAGILYSLWVCTLVTSTHQGVSDVVTYCPLLLLLLLISLSPVFFNSWFRTKRLSFMLHLFMFSVCHVYYLRMICFSSLMPQMIHRWIEQLPFGYMKASDHNISRNKSHFILGKKRDSSKCKIIEECIGVTQFELPYIYLWVHIAKGIPHKLHLISLKIESFVEFEGERKAFNYGW